jgi:aryl-alcohol dehydrogenase-like predicted oxidoreductase
MARLRQGMNYRYFGRTGLRISEITLGTQTFGWTTGEADAHAMLDHYIDSGGNYLDTADSYNDGESERILGSWIRARKSVEDVIIGTKVYFDSKADENSNRMGLSRKHLNHSIDRSLKRLGLETIDLYQLHCIDGGTGLDEVMDSLEDLVRRGKIHHYGLSNFTPSAIAKMVCATTYKAQHRPASLQLEYSLLVRSAEWELLPLCTEEDVATLAWSPLAGGWLTGKYKRSVPPPANSREGRRDRWEDQEERRGGQRTWAILDVLETIGGQRNVPVSQVALNWMRRKPAISSTLIGARTMEQLRENLECVAWDMSPEEEERLDVASELPLPYPYNFVGRYSRKRRE